MTCETDSKMPPMEWYEGIAFPEEGIRIVGIGTRAFFDLHPDLTDKWSAWTQTRPMLGGEIKVLSPEEAQIHTDTGVFIQQATGFAPELLMRYGRGLEGIYAGQSMGPFPFSVEWITK